MKIKYFVSLTLSDIVYYIPIVKFMTDLSDFLITKYAYIELLMFFFYYLDNSCL